MRSTNQANNEHQLVQKVSEGDHQAFQVLFDRFHTEIYRFCMLMLDDREMAEDVYQETFANFYAMCRQKKNIWNVHGLLLTIARNHCLNLYKVSKRTVSLEELPDSGWELNIEKFDVNNHLREALQQIPDQYREALLLFEVEGYTYQEISMHLKIGRHVVKNRIYYAKRMLRTLLEPILYS